MVYELDKGVLEMDITLEQLRLELCKKLLTYEADHYNENTYNFSQGYRKCLIDIILELESESE